MRPKNTPLAELMSYTAASAVALALDVAVLTLLVAVCRWSPLGASIASFVAGAVLLYVLSVKFVFSNRRLPHPVVELPAFLALGLVGLCVNSLVIHALTDTLHLHYLIAKCGAAGCTFCLNYLLRRRLMFPALHPVVAVESEVIPDA